MGQFYMAKVGQNFILNLIKPKNYYKLKKQQHEIE